MAPDHGTKCPNCGARVKRMPPERSVAGVETVAYVCTKPCGWQKSVETR